MDALNALIDSLADGLEILADLTTLITGSSELSSELEAVAPETTTETED